MGNILAYFAALDRNQLILQASVAIIALIAVRTLLGGSSGHRKLLEQRKKKQSVPVTDAKSGEGAVYRNAEFKDKLIETDNVAVKTLNDQFNATVAQYGNDGALGTRKKEGERVGDYQWETYSQVDQRRKNLGSGIINMTGLKFDEPVGIYSINRAEWLIADLACIGYRWPSVALYDTLGQNAVEFIIKHAELKIVICGGKQATIIINAATNCPSLKYVINMDAPTPDQIELAKQKGVQLLNFKDVEANGAQKPRDFVASFPETIYTIMYTSGTTGDPKGVLLTHGNGVSEVASLRLMEPGIFTKDDIHMSYLPLAHSFERIATYTILACGGKIGYYQGNINELFNDIATLRPTYLIGAPRVWSRLYDKLTLTIDQGGGLKKKMFYMGFAAKQAALKRGESTPLWDKLVFSKTKARLGGRVRFILSGSAPLDPKLGEFLKICFCCNVMEGYGLTENFAGACITPFEETQLGHVGRPLPCCEVKLQDVPEMNYSSKNTPPTGEIMIRGNNVFKGYFKDPEKTKEALEADGWFHTGDIGRWNENGTLSIIDRKKNIFKLAQGEYVAVEYLEGIYKRSQFVAQIWVYGNSYKRWLVGVVVPDPEYLAMWAKQNGMEGQDYKTLVLSERVNQAIVKDLERVGKEAKLNGIEFVKAIHLTSDAFTVDNDHMTPTFKLRRVNLLKSFQKKIDEMYAKIGD